MLKMDLQPVRMAGALNLGLWTTAFFAYAAPGALFFGLPAQMVLYLLLCACLGVAMCTCLFFGMRSLRGSALKRGILVLAMLIGALLLHSSFDTWLYVGMIFDYLLLDNRGRATVPAGDAILSIAATSPLNPFEQQVHVSRSVPWDALIQNRSFTQRVNVGLIARLPREWMVEGDLSQSRSLVRVNDGAREASYDAAKSVLLGEGRVGPDLSPFAPQKEFVAAYGAYQLAGGSVIDLRDQLDAVNLRASGPLWRLPGGPITMTVTAEAFREEAPGGISTSFDRFTNQPLSVEGNRLRLTTRSAYGEWRFPLTAADRPGPFAGTELQVALRADDYRVTAPQSNTTVGQDPTMSPVAARNLVMAKTLGLKTFVAEGVMLRASYSEGHLPPRSDQIQPRVISFDRGFAVIDQALHDDGVGARQ